MNILSNSPIIFSLQENQIYKNGLFVTEEFQAKLFQFYSPHFTWKTKISKVNDQKQNPTKSMLILEPSCIGLGSFHKLCLHFLTRYVPSLHFLCSKIHVFLTTYPPVHANVIFESSLALFWRQTICNFKRTSITCVDLNNIVAVYFQRISTIFYQEEPTYKQ